MKSFKEFLEESDDIELRPDQFYHYDHRSKKLDYLHPFEGFTLSKQGGLYSAFGHLQSNLGYDGRVIPPQEKSHHSVAYVGNDNTVKIGTATSGPLEKDLSKAKEVAHAISSLEPGSEHYLNVHTHMNDFGLQRQPNMSIHDFKIFQGYHK